MTAEDAFFAIACVVAPSALVSILIFGRYTVARIERQIRQDGLERPCPWDGPGIRIPLYNYAIGLPISRFNSALIDAQLVRRYATPIDVLLSRITMLFMSFLIVLIIAAPLLGVYD